MKIEIKKSQKPVKYEDALRIMEKRLLDINQDKSNDLIWILEHDDIYTAGTNYKENEIIDKSIKIFKTNRGGKITYHGFGQLICYFVIDLRKRNKDIRRFVNLIEKVIIESLKKYNIYSFSDRKNVGIWTKNDNRIKKIGAIGIKIKNWIAFHGFSLNINNSLSEYKKIIPCGIKDKDITNLRLIRNQNYKKIKEEIISNFIKCLEV